MILENLPENCVKISFFSRLILVCFAYFHTDFRCIVQLLRHDRSMVVRHSNMSMVLLAMFCDPNDTSGNCIVILVVVPCTNTNGIRIRFRFHRPIDMLAPRLLATLCRCSNGCQRIERPFHQPHRCVALRSYDYFYTPAMASNINSRNSPSPAHRLTEQIARWFDDLSRSAHISSYCNRIRLIGKQIVSGILEIILVRFDGPK